MAAPVAIRKPTRKAPTKPPIPPPRKVWTVADLYRKFGPIPFERIRQDPPPGRGTVEDVDWLNNHEDRLYELVDGILVEKTVGIEESYIGGTILVLLRQFVVSRRPGVGLPRRWCCPARYQPGADSRRDVHLSGPPAGR